MDEVQAMLKSPTFWVSSGVMGAAMSMVGNFGYDWLKSRLGSRQKRLRAAVEKNVNALADDPDLLAATSELAVRGSLYGIFCLGLSCLSAIAFSVELQIHLASVTAGVQNVPGSLSYTTVYIALIALLISITILMVMSRLFKEVAAARRRVSLRRLKSSP